MYKWQIVWCILSADHCRLHMAYSPILHSAQKKHESNSCVVLFMGLSPTAAIITLLYGKGLLSKEHSPM